MPDAESETSEATRIEIYILGQRLFLKPTSDPHHLDTLVSYVKRKVDEVAEQSHLSGTKLVVLAALNIADDYFRVLKEGQNFRQDVAARSKTLLAVLDEYLSQ